jgi:hypothetical protein
MSPTIALVCLLLVAFGLGIAMLACWYKCGIRRSLLVVACILPLLIAMGEAAILASGSSLSFGQLVLPLKLAGLVSAGTLVAWSLRSVPETMDPMEGAFRVFGTLLFVALAQVVLVVAILLLGAFVGGR